MERSGPASGHPEEVAWAAGFFDGDGCFSYTKAGKYVAVTIGQVGRERLDRFRSAVGVGRVLGPYDVRHPSRPSKLPQFVFRANGCERVRAIASGLWPHLGPVKRAQAQSALSSAEVTCTLHNEHDPLSDSQPRPLGAWREDLAWAAGFMEADGTFSYGTSRQTYRSPCVAIGQNSREVLDRFRKIVGLGKVYGPYDRAPGGLEGRPMFQYRVSGHERVQAVAGMLWFRLGTTRRAQARRVLSFLTTTCHRGHPKQPGHNACARCTADYWASYREQHPNSPDVARYPRKGRIAIRSR